MKYFLFFFIALEAFALTDKSKTIPPPVEEKVENTTLKSQLRPVDIEKPVVLHHREPMLLPNGKMIEVTYFSHKTAIPDESRRASVGIKIKGETTEIVVLHQDVDRLNKEKLSSAESEDYVIKLDKILYDDQITVTITPK